MGMEIRSRALLGSTARGIRSVRADSTPTLLDIKAMIDNVQKTFADFKAENDKALADVRKDVVQTEKVDRINSAVGDLQKGIDEANRKIAALQVNGTGDPNDKRTPEQREHAKAFKNWFRKGAGEANLRDLEVKAALRTDSDPDGGYLTDVETEATIDRVLGTVSTMRSLATVRQISGGVYKKLVNQGGATSGWVGERQTRSETDTPTLAAIEYPAMELYANPGATQTSLDDSRINIEQWLADEVAIEFAEEEGAAFITGNGVNKPRGILAYTTVANASYAWNSIGHVVTGEAADFIAEDPGDPFINLVYALKQGYRQNASWLMNRTNQGKVRKFKDDQDNYLWAPGLQAGQPATFLGYPINDDDNMPDVAANAYPVAFGDFRRAYLVVDRAGIRVLRDPFTNKPYVMFYTTKRVGGGIQNFEAIKLLKCST